MVQSVMVYDGGRCNVNDNLGVVIVRRLAPFAVLAVFLGGCSNDGKSNSSQTDESSSSGLSEDAECLTEESDGGDLKISDSAFTVLNPESAKGDYLVTWVVEVTNQSKVDTAMVAGLSVTLTDDRGKQISSSGDNGFTRDLATVEYLAPGKHQFVAGVFEGVEEQPAELSVELPDSVSRDGSKSTYWWPHEDVTYPPELSASNVELQDSGSGGVQINFDVDNPSDENLTSISPVTILRDKKGQLVGGQFSGPFSMNAFEEVNVPPGKSSVSLKNAFPNGLPSGVSTSGIEIQLSSSPDWTSVDENCDFEFDV